MFLGVIQTSLASEHQRIDTLGSSSKGQFVALEEYSYVPHSKTFKVMVRVMNVWTKEFVGKTILIEHPARRPFTMEKTRQEARLQAGPELLRFKISG